MGIFEKFPRWDEYLWKAIKIPQLWKYDLESFPACEEIAAASVKCDVQASKQVHSICLLCSQR